jgi:RHS repeat-associated protein
LFDNTGAVTDTFDYDAFGILIGRTGATANSYLYRGQQFDADLGFYYNRARYYDQSKGRFLNRDVFEGTISEPNSLQKYLYAHADPVNFYDPSGYLNMAERVLLVAGLAYSIQAYRHFSRRLDYSVRSLIDGFGGDDPPPDPSKICKITLASRPVELLNLGMLGLNHMYVTFSEKEGNSSGNSSEKVFVSQGLKKGEFLEGFVEEFKPGNFDYDGEQRAGGAVRKASVEASGSCDSVRKSFEDTKNRVNAARFVYEIPVFSGAINDINNSNAFAYTSLYRWNATYLPQLESQIFAGFSRAHVPGWGYYLEI